MQLKAETVGQLHEVADLMLEIYQTLARMKYFDEECIEKGPHDITALIPEYQAREIDPSIIYLYSILPYVGSPAPQDFYQHGELADFRRAHKLDESRDPFWTKHESDFDSDDSYEEDSNEEEDETMAPWMTPLSFVGGSHATAIIYSAKKHAIWIFGQDSSGTLDPVLHSNRGRVYLDGEEEHGIYCNSDGRPAADVLRDINNSYESLENVPGQGHWGTAEWKEAVVRPLYEKHGWLTGNFDGEAFLIDQARAKAKVKVRDFMKFSEARLADLRTNVAEDDDPKWNEFHEKIAAATTLEDEWMARWELVQERYYNLQYRFNLEEALKEAEAKRCFKEDDMVLWEQDWLENEVQKTSSLVEYYERNPTQEDDVTKNRLIRQTQNMIPIYRKAEQAAKVEAEQFFPDKTLQQICGNVFDWGTSDRSHAQQVDSKLRLARDKFDQVERFYQSLPDGLTTLRETVQKRLKIDQEVIDYFKKSLEATLADLEK